METKKSRVVVHLFRSLLRFAKQADNHPSLQVMIIRQIFADLEDSYAKSIVRKLVPKSTFGPLSAFEETKQQSRFASFVRSEFRTLQADKKLNEKIDTGFSFLKKTSALWSIFAKFNINTAAPRQDLPISVSIWKERDLRGKLLVAHPLVQGVFRRSVVLVVDALEVRGDEMAHVGVIVNRPTGVQLRKAVIGLPNDILDTVGDCIVNYGGPVRRLQTVHRFPISCGGTEIKASTGCYHSSQVGLVLSAIKGSPCFKLDLSIFSGCCTWDAKQLSQEVANGYWLPVDASPSAVLEMLAKSQKECSDKPDLIENGLWSKLLCGLGGSFIEISKTPDWFDGKSLELV